MFSQDNVVILRGWCKLTRAKIWRFSFLPQALLSLLTRRLYAPSSLNAHDLPIIGSLVYYLHTAAGFPVNSTWLAAIRAGDFSSWTGLTFANAAKYCPVSEEALKGHLAKSRKGVWSTKREPPLKTVSIDSLQDITSQLLAVKSQELHFWVEPIIKLNTDDIGPFPVRSRCGNRYIMLAYHIDTNTILVSAFQYLNNRHRLAAYNNIMNRLKPKEHSVDLQVLDNEASAEYRRTIVEYWNCTFQLVPLDVHHRNIAERTIRTFKYHFLAILSGVADSFTNFL